MSFLAARAAPTATSGHTNREDEEREFDDSTDRPPHRPLDVETYLDLLAPLGARLTAHLDLLVSSTSSSRGARAGAGGTCAHT